MKPKPDGADCDRASQRRFRVLVAETDRRLRSVLSRTLDEGERFRVVAQASNAAELAASATPVDLASVDLNLPGSVGLATITDLRQRVPSAVIVVLADAWPVYLRHAAAAEGASAFVG
jgi:DNA-binding NarL/FixJ family response regulator